jgi:hypothetical protein
MKLSQFILNKDLEDHYNYFAANILLLSDLCLDRNNIAINELKEIYKFPMCSKIINSNNYGHKL